MIKTEIYQAVYKGNVYQATLTSTTTIMNGNRLLWELTVYYVDFFGKRYEEFSRAYAQRASAIKKLERYFKGEERVVWTKVGKCLWR